MILIVLRPQPDCGVTATAARETGLEAHGFPLFEVRPLAWHLPEADSFDALLIGSANSLRHAGEKLSAMKGKPAYAVGETTASSCRQAGLNVIATGVGGLQQVLFRLNPSHTRLLRLTGSARVSLEPPPQVNIIERIVYSSDPLPMPAALAQLLSESAVIALHSAEAARHFREQCEARSLDLARHSLACIGPRVAEAAGLGWRAVLSAACPSEAALLALAREMCEDGDHG